MNIAKRRRLCMFFCVLLDDILAGTDRDRHHRECRILADARHPAGAIGDEDVLNVVRLAVLIHDARLGVGAHAGGSDLMNAESWHGVLAGKMDVLRAGRFEHFCALLPRILPQLFLVVAILGIDAQYGDTPGVDPIVIDFDVILLTRQALGPEAEINAPVSPANGILVARAEAWSAEVETGRAAALIAVAADEAVRAAL